MIEKEAKRLGYEPKELLKNDRLMQVAKKFNIHTEEDLLASLGFGGITVNGILTKLIDLHKQELKENAAPDVSKLLSELKPQQGEAKKSSHGVLVEGEAGILVHLARCCNPIPGDPIVGFVTKGRGVSVHRSDCSNIFHDAGDYSRALEVDWDIGIDREYTVQIVITCNDRSGMLTSLLAVTSEMKVNISSINAKPNRHNKTSTVIMGLDVKNAQQLSQIMTKFRRVKDVYSVSRTMPTGVKETHEADGKEGTE